MRLWSLHPGALDRQGLLALWREGLLARKVLAVETRGYRQHPQLERFRDHPDPGAAIAAYLHAVADEADRRGYRFDRNRIGRRSEPAEGPSVAPLSVTEGQLRYEANHLAAKLAARRAAGRFPPAGAGGVNPPRPHPLFRVVPGGVAEWERVRKL